MSDSKQPSSETFRVAVKDHVMIAHSLSGAVFGPAQRMHGATYEVITEYAASRVDENGIVLDIGLATETLQQVLNPLRFTNLDELPQFAGQNTTTEFLAKWIHGQVSAALAGKFAGQLRVTLEESRVAWASYESELL
ncbi:6-carboxytetrahydropterin synthase [bacterium]|nr:6-carboxytetrahydropterin synthase [bacterium]